MNDFLTVLKKQKLSLHNEKSLQHNIEMVLSENNFTFFREYRLSNESIIDFFIDDIGIEVKLNGTAKSIYKQCERYLQFAQVKGLLLVTNKAIHLPDLINNKPVKILNISIAWL